MSHILKHKKVVTIHGAVKDDVYSQNYPPTGQDVIEALQTADLTTWWVKYASVVGGTLTLEFGQP